MYRHEDAEKITSNLSKITNDAAKVFLDNYQEPTTKVYNSVMSEIKNYIKKKGLIIYGGFAQNSLIGVKNKNDEFYSEISRADLEIYTPDPIGDAIALTDILHGLGYKPVECKEGVHNETYKIFVDFLNFADISYMDSHIYKNCPYIVIDGLKMIHPHFMLVDAYRVYADPMTSYFRLEKTFTRFSTLLKHYLFDVKAEFNKLSYKRTDENDQVLRFVRKHIIQNSKLIVIGHYAFNYLVKKLDDKNAIDFNYIQLVSTDFKNDFDKINKIIKDEYKNKAYYTRYNPFFQFYDEHVEFSYNGRVFLKLYGNNNRCIVHQYSDKKRTYFATVLLTILYLLVDYNYAVINKDKSEEMNYMSLIVRLFKIRNEYLDSRNLSILDKSPFQEFTLKCTGTPEDPIRSSMLRGLEKIKSGKRVKFSYRSNGTPGKAPNFKFSNSSGLPFKKQVK